MNSVRPAPVAVFTARGQGTTHLLWVLAPSRPGEPGPVTAVESLDADGLSARIRLRDGRTHEVRFSGAGPVDLRLGQAGGRGRALLVETRAGGAAREPLVVAP
jgi:hypothetical protein